MGNSCTTGTTDAVAERPPSARHVHISSGGSGMGESTYDDESRMEASRSNYNGNNHRSYTSRSRQSVGESTMSGGQSHSQYTESLGPTVSRNQSQTRTESIDMPQRKPALKLPDDSGFHPSVNGRNGWTMSEIYTAGKELGRGAFGAVYVGTHKFSQQPGEDDEDDDFAPEWKYVAIKRTRPNSLDLRDANGEINTYGRLERRCQEVKTLLKLQEGSPSMSPVLYLYEIFMSGRDYYMVTEQLDQELDDWRQEVEMFTERMAIDICKTVLSAIDFMHDRDVVHRDLKLQNMMFRRRGDFRSLKIVDFGLARVLEQGETARDFCGSIGYIAPEIYLGEAYQFEVDMFAFGVTLFRLLSGERPFPSNNSQILKRHTIECRYNVSTGDWQNVSPAAKDLIRKLLINKQERLTAQQALGHRWFQEEGSSVLPRDLTHIGTVAHGGGDARDAARSRAIARSHAPKTASLSRADGRFWIDRQLQIALITIISAGIYSAQEVNEKRTDESTLGMICIEETPSPDCVPIPEFVKDLRTYTEMDCRNIILQLANAIKTMHDAGIAHRNLNLENVVIDPLGSVSLRGLRYAQPILEGVPLTGHFGYLYSWYAFKAPEVDSEFVHDKSVDLWSLGAIMYMLLTGLPPFRGSGMELIEMKHTGMIDFEFVPVSRYAEELVRNLLQVQPEMRYTIDDVLNDRWMIESDDFLERFDLEVAHSGFEDWRNVG